MYYTLAIAQSSMKTCIVYMQGIAQCGTELVYIYTCSLVFSEELNLCTCN